MSRSLIFRALRVFGLVLLVAGLTRLAWGYVFIGPKWAPNSRITLALSLTGGSGLQDGSSSFNAVAQSAASLWNQFLEGGVVLQTTTSGFPPASYADGHCNLLFAFNPYSGSYGDAIALCYIVDSGGTNIIEADILFDRSLTWNSYRGPQQGSGASAVFDFRRVAIHELGHLLGLDHPDERGQSVSAIMNSTVSNIDVMQQDDINGVRALYRPGPTTTPSPTPSPTRTPTPTPTPFPPGFQTPTPTPSPTRTPTPTATPTPMPTLPPQALAGAQLFAYRSPGLDVSLENVAATGSAFAAPNFQPMYRVATRPYGAGTHWLDLISFRDAAAPESTSRVPYIYMLRAHPNARIAPGSYSGPSYLHTFTPAFAVSLGMLQSNAFPFNADYSMPFSVFEAQVHEVEYAPDGALRKLSMDYSCFVSIFSTLTGFRVSSVGHLRYQSDLPIPGPRLINLSTRLNVGAGENVGIAGFVVSGTRSKSVVVRALGPSLQNFGVANALAKPRVRVFDSAGQQVGTGRTAQEVPGPLSTARALNPTSFLEPACELVLPPGAYTAIVDSVDGASGIALIEVYDCDVGTSSRPVNVSTRGRVGLGDAAMIGGFVVGGPTPKRLLVRAIGPSLAAFGIAGALADPIVEVRNSSGELVAQNDNWTSRSGEIQATPFVPSNPSEAALVVTLPAGAYTAIVRGTGDTIGVGLVEVYELDVP